MIGRLATLVRALLLGFARDRGALLLAFAAPIAFSALIGLFYAHLDSPKSARATVLLIVAPGASDAAERLAAEIAARSSPRLTITRGIPSDEPPLGIIEIPSSFDANAPTVAIESRAPLPGFSDALRLLVDAAYVQSAGDAAPVVVISNRTEPGVLLRANAAAIPVLFVLFALSSLVARGLGDDESGLADRLSSLGMTRRVRLAAALAALAVIAWLQIVVTLLFLAVAFGIRPAEPIVLLLVAALSALACAASVLVLSEACGSRARFAAIAPVATLLLSGLSGSMIPVELLPDALAAPSRWLFTRWCIDACSAATVGGSSLHAVLALAAWTICIACVAWWLAGRDTTRGFA